MLGSIFKGLRSVCWESFVSAHPARSPLARFAAAWCPLYGVTAKRQSPLRALKTEQTRLEKEKFSKDVLFTHAPLEPESSPVQISANLLRFFPVPPLRASEVSYLSVGPFPLSFAFCRPADGSDQTPSLSQLAHSHSSSWKAPRTNPPASENHRLLGAEGYGELAMTTCKKEIHQLWNSI